MTALNAKSIEELEGHESGEPTFDSYLVTTIHRLRRKPIGQFTTEDLRIMIGQAVGLSYLIPIALEKLTVDPLAQGDFYPGDLLLAVLRIDGSFWPARSAMCKTLSSVTERAVAMLDTSEEAAERRAVAEAFEAFGRHWTDE